MPSPLWLVTQSLALDRKFLAASRWPLSKKLAFLGKKYALIAKHLRAPFRLGDDHTTFAGETIYYDSRYGLAGYQSLLARHQRLLRDGGVREARTILDVGANVGFFSKLCRELYPEATIHAFEPVPRTFECLRRNFEGDPLTHVHRLAIGAAPGEATMAFDEADPAIARISEAGSVPIRVETLDRFAAARGVGEIDLLKIDTETFEADVLRGAAACLARTRHLFIEITVEGNARYTISSLLGLLVGDGYDFQLVGFRNYLDRGDGAIPIMDALLVNTRA
jgi:FkbM family methyltransferase